MAKIRHWGGSLTHPPVLVGEDNPYGSRPANALLPEPAGSAGHRLCVKVFGMDPRQYLLAFLRYNLCTGEWNAVEARRRANGLWQLYRPNVKILLGSKVARAFDVHFIKPFEYHRYTADDFGPVLVLPHPSGRCRAWNAPGAYERARDALEEVVRG